MADCPGSEDAPETNQLNAPLRDDELADHQPGAIPESEPGNGGFGRMLEPVLDLACHGRLSPVRWFRTDWQRGGALTGYATFEDDDGRARDVVVKMPVPPCERHWLVELQGHADVVPKVYAHGDALGAYDLAWVVMERLPHGPLGLRWGGAAFDLLTEAAGRFYEASSTVELRGERRDHDWQAMFERARKQVHNKAVAEHQRWKKNLKKAHRKLDDWITAWLERPSGHWVHGDLHLANAMTRVEPPNGPAVLFDFAWTRPGCWLEDAVYFEHLYWARRDRLEGRKLISMIAKQRRERGLDTNGDWAQLADTGRALMAMATPAMLHDDGDPTHVAAAVEVLERFI